MIIDKTAQKRILNYLKQQISSPENPRFFGKTLTGDKQSLWRYRVGDYRIICQLIDRDLIILAIKVDHRRSINNINQNIIISLFL